MKTNRSHRLHPTIVKKFQKVFYLLICLFSFNACLLNPIVHHLLFPDKESSSKTLLALWALLANAEASVELNRNWAGIRKGDSLQLEAQYYIYGARTDSTFQWSSSNKSVATVDANGLVQSIGNGKVIITATSIDGRAKADCDITVYTGYVYTSLDSSNSVGHLTMDEISGLLTFNSSVLVGTSTPTGIGVEPFGKFLYTGDFGGASISQFLINQLTGVLSQNTPITVPAGLSPRNLVITPDGKYLYLASEGTSAIRAYSINTDGTLSFLTSYPTNIGHSQIQISRSGSFIFYMGNSITEITSYRINSNDGSLSQAAISPSFPNDGSGHVSTHPNGNFIYVGSSPSVTILRLDKNTGNMSFVDSVFHGLSVNSTAIHPSGLFYYLLNINEGIISCYLVDPKTGKITYSSNVTGFVPGNLRFMIIDPTGRFAYAADINAANLLQFSINQTTGALTSIGNVNPGGNPWNLTFL
ncbi:beta-propeller fold lactonase family protein [Leptospira sp. 2 VSF19]|uniref:Beta-propeller fold lactonase family protein n=1 Tax=Leptospira soteropolitanensis TaxID=2950025 RepID=A0AAW5VE32_9LEPT|nr:beta-propeller fold lactonase family protein [Leptospira soteropolitanensis]MCW7491943.1 beta-propeller fold lactonase family protein [Leptospira soteropolitanensis]MCW7499527.1 beta-propeller fold lactonase family protein [Leptospira soteropolitanensis]MCW7520882.1 beta-propeller fold lactonase family protein [Leptospira soteropolitanensis]MCW7525631.1 beta-propeller fold lactonase family protein [Leptospira soteropolitanensis]MCW7529497.1 beta-propeller fold lactonase family protein [Lept